MRNCKRLVALTVWPLRYDTVVTRLKRAYIRLFIDWNGYSSNYVHTVIIVLNQVPLLHAFSFESQEDRNSRLSTPVRYFNSSNCSNSCYNSYLVLAFDSFLCFTLYLIIIIIITIIYTQINVQHRLVCNSFVTYFCILLIFNFSIEFQQTIIYKRGTWYL